jgi:hypothetical protein
VVLTDVIILVKGKNSLLKISLYLQTTFAAETHLAEGITFARWRTSKIEKTLD